MYDVATHPRILERDLIGKSAGPSIGQTALVTPSAQMRLASTAIPTLAAGPHGHDHYPISVGQPLYVLADLTHRAGDLVAHHLAHCDIVAGEERRHVRAAHTTCIDAQTDIALADRSTDEGLDLDGVHALEHSPTHLISAFPVRR
ncbi:MAG TPA: hypothetical protein VE219_05695 [Candidatus Sulfotelmatobacter sp.]|nr:hypothetical protein [Candidatus Sulfotelmatobacter sp.]